MYTVIIREGEHQTDKRIRVYVSLGGLDQAIEGARILCGRMQTTRGKRVYVSFSDEKWGILTTHIFQEGLA